MASPRPHRSFGKRRWALTLAVLLLVFVESVSPAPSDDAPADSDDARAEEDAGAETREITDDTAGAGAGTAVAPRMQAARSRSRAWACGATVKASVLELRRRVDAAGRGARTQIFGEGWVIRPKRNLAWRCTAAPRQGMVAKGAARPDYPGLGGRCTKTGPCFICPVTTRDLEKRGAFCVCCSAVIS